ncbi:MAG: RNA methyltransferase, partial [Pseudomonadota bacterium]
MQHRRKRKPSAPKRALDVVIDHIGAKGDGVAYVDNQPVFVPYTAPGDQCGVEAVGDRGALITLHEESAERAPPPCRYYGRCGGCALQHVSPAFYQSWKKALAADALSSADVDAERIDDLVAVPQASRRRVQLYVERQGRGVSIGFYERRSRNLVAINECLILHPALSDRLAALMGVAAATPQGWRAFSLSATHCDNGLDINLDHRAPLTEPAPANFAALSHALADADGVRLSLHGDPFLTLATPMITIDGVALSPPPGGFLQASADGEAALVRLVRDAVGGARKIADLFCGAGTFVLPLARSASVAAFDSDIAAT